MVYWDHWDWWTWTDITHQINTSGAAREGDGKHCDCNLDFSQQGDRSQGDRG